MSRYFFKAGFEHHHPDKSFHTYQAGQVYDVPSEHVAEIEAAGVAETEEAHLASLAPPPAEPEAGPPATEVAFQQLAPVVEVEAETQS